MAFNIYRFPLRKLAREIYREFFKKQKIVTFIWKKMFTSNLYFYSKHTLWVQVRWQGGSNEYPQCMFWIKNKKIRYTPANPSFWYIKVWFKGVNIARTCFPDEENSLV